MKIVILDKSTLGEDIDLTPIYDLGEVQEYPTTEYSEVSSRVREADVIITNKIKLNAETLSGAQNLRLICVAATGYDNIDTEYLKGKGIALCNVPGYSTDSVAQVTVSMALSIVTHLREYRQFVHSGDYSRSGVANKLSPVYHEVSSMKWGVVGGGAIGTAVARIASAMGAQVMMCRRKQEGDYPLADMDTLCRECDILSLHIPLSDSTRGILSRKRIAMMKKNAVVVNTARGAVCDEQALADAIKEQRIGGLGVDVYSAEPFPADHPFSEILGYDNVCLTPHMGWGSAEARARCVSIMAENIRNFYAENSHNRIV